MIVERYYGRSYCHIHDGHDLQGDSDLVGDWNADYRHATAEHLWQIIPCKYYIQTNDEEYGGIPFDWTVVIIKQPL